jgi:DNA-binding response OmpR family regulator
VAKILIVEDDLELGKVVNQALAFENHTTELVSEGIEALQRMQVYEYDMVILDWNLPGMEGLEICKRYRASGGQALVLMLTGKGSISDKETGLDAGADDYLTKPFNTRELTARVRALLRRSGDKLSDNLLKIKNITLDPLTYSVKRDGEDIKLVPKEFALLEFLMRHPNRVYSPEALLNHVWTAEQDTSPDIIRTHIKNLRKKLDARESPSLIETVHGVGYKIATD